MGNQDQRVFSSDALQQALDQCLRRLVAPVRVFQQQQHGPVQWRHQQIFENCESFLLSLIRSHLDGGQRVAGRNLEQFRQQQRRRTCVPADTLQHSADAI